MKKSLLLLAALVAIPTFATGKMKVSGQKVTDTVSEKDGVYSVKVQGKSRLQLFPEKSYMAAAENIEFEVSAEVSGNGTVNFGLHQYASPLVWKASTGSETVTVQSDKFETLKATLTVKRADIIRVLPFISIVSGEVNVKNMTITYKNALNKNNAATAPVLAGWQYTYANAIDCTMKDDVLHIITVGRQMTEIAAPFRKAAPGEKIQLTGSISGKGKISVGLHLYDASRTWQGAIWTQVNVDGELKTLPALTVVTPKGKKAVCAVRPVIRINENSNITISDIK